MSKLTTDSVKVGGGMSKTLLPGNESCKINGIELKPFTFKPGGYHMIIYLESPDKGIDFEGFWINKDDESKGRYKGQIGQVKTNYWAYSDGETKGGTPIIRDAEILKTIKGLAIALGIQDSLKAFEAKYNNLDTIEEYITALNLENPFKDKFMQYCIAGKEYTNKGGYTAYDLYLPKFEKTGVPYGTSRVLKFDEEKHIVKTKVVIVDEFAPTNDEIPSGIAPENTDLIL